MSGTVAAIVAAAGLSRRMGSCKQLLDLGGRTVIARCIETLMAGGIGEIVVVVGVKGEGVAAEAGRFPVRVVVNPDPEGDMASSVRVGRSSLGANARGVIVALCDCPLVSADTINSLSAAHAGHPGSVIIPVHDGRRGHPTLFPLAALDELNENATLRDLVRRDPHRLQLLEVDDPGILQDMDTPDDYRLLQAQISRSNHRD
ncbi:MAG TPA: nucleotidyltransferase family protein [Geobacteraceae bacterium]|nr:nucleotidyltransferase family protein [Geobacteraceae bacterium]